MTEPDPTIPVSERFRSIQGEGVLAGVPSFFVRFAGCNLRCRWCDTPYASWHPESDAARVSDVVEAARRSNTRHAVLTGGEPMMFDAIEPLSRALRAEGLHVTVETAGTIYRPPDRLACDLLSLSPKLADSTPIDDPRDPTGVWTVRHEERRLPIPVLARLLDEYREHQVKFVVSKPSEIGEIEGVLARLPAVAADRVLLMPEGVEPGRGRDAEWVVQACLDRGWRYCHRVHIEVFGDTRGT